MPGLGMKSSPRPLLVLSSWMCHWAILSFWELPGHTFKITPILSLLPPFPLPFFQSPRKSAASPWFTKVFYLYLQIAFPLRTGFLFCRTKARIIMVTFGFLLCSISSLIIETQRIKYLLECYSPPPTVTKRETFRVGKIQVNNLKVYPAHSHFEARIVCLNFHLCEV